MSSEEAVASGETAASQEVVGELEVQLSVIDAISDGEEMKVENEVIENTELSTGAEQASLEQSELVDEDANEVLDELVSSYDQSRNRGVHYAQRYRTEWEQEEFCKVWISPYPNNVFMAWCKACNRNLHARKNDLLKHNISQRHKENMEIFQQTGTPGELGKKNRTSFMLNVKFLEHPKLRDWLRPVPNSPHRSWCALCACFLSPQLSGLLMHAKSMKHRRNLKRRPVRPPNTHMDGSVGVEKEKPTKPVAEATTDTENSPCRSNKRIRKVKRPWTPTKEDHSVCASTPAREPATEEDSASGLSDGPGSPLLPDTDFADRVTFAIGLSGRKVGFLGSGQMAQSMAQGMLDQGLISPQDIMVSAPSNRHMSVWRRWQCSVTNDNDVLLANTDIIVIAVKSSVLARLIDALQPLSDSRMRLFVSVIPGVSRERVHQLLSSRISAVQLEEVRPTDDSESDPQPPSKPAASCSSLHVVRCAPNKMVALGVGFSAFCMGSDLPHGLHLAVETIFSSLGTCVEVDESLMDAYTTTVGCGAAFTCAFIEALVQGTVNLDVPWDEALKACACVVLGTSKMVLQSGRQPAELRRAICTPGGSTIAGVAALQRGGIDDTVVSAMELSCRKTTASGENI